MIGIRMNFLTKFRSLNSLSFDFVSVFCCVLYDSAALENDLMFKTLLLRLQLGLKCRH